MDGYSFTLQFFYKNFHIFKIKIKTIRNMTGDSVGYGPQCGSRLTVQGLF